MCSPISKTALPVALQTAPNRPACCSSNCPKLPCLLLLKLPKLPAGYSLNSPKPPRSYVSCILWIDKYRRLVCNLNIIRWPKIMHNLHRKKCCFQPQTAQGSKVPSPAMPVPNQTECIFKHGIQVLQHTF